MAPMERARWELSIGAIFVHQRRWTVSKFNDFDAILHQFHHLKVAIPVLMSSKARIWQTIDIYENSPLQGGRWVAAQGIINNGQRTAVNELSIGDIFGCTRFLILKPVSGGAIVFGPHHSAPFCALRNWSIYTPEQLFWVHFFAAHDTCEKERLGDELFRTLRYVWFCIEKEVFSGSTILHFVAPCENDRLTLKKEWLADAPCCTLRYVWIDIEKEVLSGCTILHLATTINSHFKIRTPVHILRHVWFHIEKTTVFGLHHSAPFCALRNWSIGTEGELISRC